jgi:hypothetical protein
MPLPLELVLCRFHQGKGYFYPKLVRVWLVASPCAQPAAGDCAHAKRRGWRIRAVYMDPAESRITHQRGRRCCEGSFRTAELARSGRSSPSDSTAVGTARAVAVDHSQVGTSATKTLENGNFTRPFGKARASFFAEYKICSAQLKAKDPQRGLVGGLWRDRNIPRQRRSPRDRAISRKRESVSSSLSSTTSLGSEQKN